MTDAWGTDAFLDRIDALMAADDFEEADRLIIAEIGRTVYHDGRTYSTAALLAGRLEEAEPELDTYRMKSRGWLASTYDGPIPETED